MASFKQELLRFRTEGRKAVVPFLVVGDPNAEESVEIACALVDAGADGLELGIAFSDPIADGPTVQAADARALAAGMNVRKAFETIAKIRGKHPGTPIGLLVYYNLLHKRGLTAFCREAQASGVDAILAADAPLEEVTPLSRECEAAGLETVMLATLETNEERLEMILEKTTGFCYLVSVLGVTGMRNTLEAETIRFVQAVRKKANVPTLVGFGISRAEQAQQACLAGADGVIVGSALIRKIEENLGNRKNAISEMVRLLKEIKSGANS